MDSYQLIVTHDVFLDKSINSGFGRNIRAKYSTELNGPKS